MLSSQSASALDVNVVRAGFEPVPNEISTGNELPPGCYLIELMGRTEFATKQPAATDLCDVAGQRCPRRCRQAAHRRSEVPQSFVAGRVARGGKDRATESIACPPPALVSKRNAIV